MITDKVRDTKAFHAAAGAGDLAVEKLREVPGKLATLREKDPRDLGGAAVSYVTHAGARAAEVFDELAERGKKVVENTDSSQATRELEDAAKATVRKARQTATTAKKAVAGATKK